MEAVGTTQDFKEFEKSEKLPVLPSPSQFKKRNLQQLCLI
jgi:hypothetical protein